ncbi:uncharacterized protein LOC132737015 isoform X2 [Ruditapes philippinarum]|uniref:uncharacterized protein LOC132737015 isoform X2 n=1 Tax=Ruditapes philippinarum TaxID=129788 RepID=UPI00295B5E6A|nr:uncharacterized protein LOC132737015 isoform X2 [Ruditapes philippinarum]
MFYQNTMASRTVTFIIFGLFLPLINARHDYKMEDYCGRQLSMSLKATYQLELELTDNNIYTNIYPWTNPKQQRSCEITVLAWYGTYPKLMFYFDDLDLDCKNGHLELYVGQTSETRVPGLEKNICGKTTQRGSFRVDSPYLRIKYVPTRVQYIKDVFSITITAFTDDGSCPIYSHKCENSLCINKGIDCDDIGPDANACDDDESDDCGDDVSGIAGTIIGATIGGLCLLGFITCIIVCCLCCKRPIRKSTVENQYQQSPVVVSSTGQHQGYNQPMYGVGQGGVYQTMQATNPSTSRNIFPTAPETTGQQYSYQEPAELFSYENIPMAPPAYSEIYGPPDIQAPPLTAKEEHVHVKLDSAKA